MTARKEVDIAIVGCGPVGAALANLLGTAGFQVVVVEAEEEIFDKPRAIVLDHEVLRLLQKCGLAQAVRAISAPHPGTDYLGVRGQIIKRFDPQPPPFPLGWPPNCTFVQPELERLLRDALGRHPGVEMLAPWRATALAEHPDRVELTIEHAANGERTTLTARYLIGTDGASSLVRQAAGFPMEDLAFDEWWMVVDVLLRRTVELPEKFVQYCRPSRPATFVIGPGDLRRWELKLLPHESPDDFRTDNQILAHLAPFIDRDAITIWRAAVYRFHALVAQRWATRRVFIAGDAAHQMPPFLGQGLCSGLRDAANLAWKLEAVLKGGASEALLSTYEAERKPHIRDLVAKTKDFGEIIGELDPGAADRRDEMLERALNSGQAETIRQRHIPPLVAGVLYKKDGAGPDEPAGSLFVQPRVGDRAGQAGLLDDLVSPGFLLVSSDPDIESLMTDGAHAQWQRIGGQTVCLAAGDAGPPAETTAATFFVDLDGSFERWRRAHDRTFALVRPDRYVFGAGMGGRDLNDMIASLAAQML